MTSETETTERDTYPQPEHGWTCFHCGETFHAVGLAAVHFGSLVDGEPACRLNQKERGLALQLRQAEEQLARYRAEDSDTDRAMHAMRADHAVALKREEEKGYERGLRDGIEHSASREAALALHLAYLSNEVIGSLPLMERLAREQIGNSNYTILMQRAQEARAALSDTSPAAERLLKIENAAKKRVGHHAAWCEEINHRGPCDCGERELKDALLTGASK